MRWAIVLDGEQNQALAFTRDLAAAGFSVAVFHSLCTAKAAWSRDAKRSIRLAPGSQSSELVDRICTELHALGGESIPVLPMTESTTIVLAQERDVLIQHGAALALAPLETLFVAFDKIQTRKIAQELGVEVPSQVVLDPRGPKEQLKSLTYPVVLKPFSSSLGTAVARGAPRRPVYARTIEDAARFFENPLAQQTTTIAQSFVKGQGIGYFALFNQGKPLLEFAHRRIRDVHPTGSGSAYREGIPLDEALRSAGRRILGRLNWHGLAMVEFKLRDDDSLVFIEINGRPWNSMALPVACGVRFPEAVARLAIGEKPQHPPCFDYQLRRARWILGDFRHLFAVLAGKPKGFPGDFPTRCATLSQLPKGLSSDVFDCFSKRDPLPEVMDWLSVMERLMRGQF